MDTGVATNIVRLVPPERPLVPLVMTCKRCAALIDVPNNLTGDSIEKIYDWHLITCKTNV